MVKTVEGKCINELLEEHSAMVLLYCRRYFRYSGYEEDIAQEVMVSALRSFEQFRGNTLLQFRAWLMAIARNIHIGHIRKEKRFTPLDCVSQNSPQLRYFDSGIRAVEAGLYLKKVSRRLTDDEIQMFYDLVIYGMSYREIAAEKGKALETIRVQFFRARKNVREAFGGNTNGAI